MSVDELKKTRELLGYAPNTAGRFMTPNYATIDPNSTAGEAIEHIRRTGRGKETLAVVYMVDRDGRLVDVFDCQLLELACSMSIRTIVSNTWTLTCRTSVIRLTNSTAHFHATPVICQIECHKYCSKAMKLICLRVVVTASIFCLLQTWRARATAAAPELEQFCFLTTSSGKVINLSNSSFLY